MTTPKKYIAKNSNACIICNVVDSRLQKIALSKINDKCADSVIMQLFCTPNIDGESVICRSCIGRLRTIDTNLCQLRNMFIQNCTVKRLLLTPTRISPPSKLLSTHAAVGSCIRNEQQISNTKARRNLLNAAHTPLERVAKSQTLESGMILCVIYLI